MQMISGLRRPTGDLYLRGTGDPTLLPSRFDELAAAIANAGASAVRGDLVADDTWFDAIRLGTDWSQYEPIVERHRRASFAITSNRSVDEWLGLFDDPILGNSALDRLANAAHQIVIEGPSYRAKLAPKHRILDDQP